MEKATIWEKYKRKFSNGNKKTSKEPKINFFKTDDEIQFLLSSAV